MNSIKSIMILIQIANSIEENNLYEDLFYDMISFIIL